VIGNELHKRKHEVVFVERTLHTKGSGNAGLTGALTPPLDESDKQLAAADKFAETWLRLGELAKGRSDEVEIEEFIISALLERHNEWIAAGLA
jgi:phosphopantothenate-cysteine ligase